MQRDMQYIDETKHAIKFVLWRIIFPCIAHLINIKSNVKRGGKRGEKPNRVIMLLIKHNYRCASCKRGKRRTETFCLAGSTKKKNK